jgi:hypothetical protein
MTFNNNGQREIPVRRKIAPTRVTSSPWHPPTVSIASGSDKAVRNSHTFTMRPCLPTLCERVSTGAADSILNIKIIRTPNGASTAQASKLSTTSRNRFIIFQLKRSL